MVISCYRNGSGKLVHIQCAKSEWLPFTYDWEHAGVDKPPEIDPLAIVDMTNYIAFEHR